MEMESKKEKTDASEQEEFQVDGVIFNFGYLIKVISDYYNGSKEKPLEDSEEWKKGTQYEPPSAKVPKDVDNVVKEAFKTQLKKFL